jgi:hypothetical protein
MLSACEAAPACQPVRALQAGEESIAKLLTTIPTQPSGKRHGFMARYGLGLVLAATSHYGWAADACLPKVACSSLMKAVTDIL